MKEKKFASSCLPPTQEETIFLSSGSSMQFILIQEIKKMLISPSLVPSLLQASSVSGVREA